MVQNLKKYTEYFILLYITQYFTYPYGMDKDLINKLENEIKKKTIQLNQYK